MVTPISSLKTLQYPFQQTEDTSSGVIKSDVANEYINIPSREDNAYPSVTSYPNSKILSEPLEAYPCKDLESRNKKELSTREKISKAMKRRWEDPSYREKKSKAMKSHWEDSSFREKVTKAMKRRREDPSVREKISKAMKSHWEDPSY